MRNAAVSSICIIYIYIYVTRDTRARQILYCGASASKHNEFAVHQRSCRRSSRRDKQLRNGLLKKEAIRLAHIYVTTAQAHQWPRACNGNASKVFSWLRVRVTSVSTWLEVVYTRPPRFAISTCSSTGSLHTCTLSRTPFGHACVSHLTPISSHRAIVVGSTSRSFTRSSAPSSSPRSFLHVYARAHVRNGRLQTRLCVREIVHVMPYRYAHACTYRLEARTRATGRLIGERAGKSLARPIETSSSHLFPISRLLVIGYRLPTNKRTRQTRCAVFACGLPHPLSNT